MIIVEKIKINLVSGSSLEKPLITAFKSNNALYVVLDNEINGTMGLPIILVSKLENNKLIKINDQNEWNAVKEMLRMIIAGNQVDYVVVDAMIAADDMFFTQLTLPTASFDALKNNYRPNALNAGADVSQGVVNPTLVNNQPVMPTPMENMAQPVENVAPVNPVPVVEPVMSQGASDVAQPVTPESLRDMANVAPVMPSAPADAQNVAEINENVGGGMPDATAASEEIQVPTVEPIPEVTNESTNTPVDFTADKEAFLKACENMFDALVAKFKN